MNQTGPVARVVGYVLGPPVEFVGRLVERRVERAVGQLPEPPIWTVPLLVVAGVVGAVVLEERDSDKEGEGNPSGAVGDGGAFPDPSEGDGRSEVEEALDVLGVEYPPVPEKSDVKAEYRSLVVEAHPDVGGDAERFKEVRAAWETVADREELSDGPADVEVTRER